MENSKRYAFPLTDGDAFTNNGLTKREYFAGLAMQGLLSNNTIELPGDDEFEFAEFSEVCVRYADSLLKQLENGN